MAKATIVEDLGSGQYSIQRNWAGREGIEVRITALRAEANLLEEKWEAMPVTTDEEVFDKNIVKLQYTTLRKKAEWLEDNMPTDATVDAWCADYTEGLSGEVGTIDIAGEYTADVNIQPGYDDDSDYDGERDGELYPAIALGPWTSFLNQCIYPGWQRFAPLHRYATIIEDSIDYENNTCAVAVQPTYSLMNYYVNKSATGGGDEPAAAGVRSTRVKNYNVNRGDILGQDQIEVILDGIAQENRALEFFVDLPSSVHPGFTDFVERNPTNPISQVTGLNEPIYISDEQYIQLTRLCRWFDYMYLYESDQSGYKISDYWDVMYDLGDPWFWVPSYSGEAQNEFTFGNVTLLPDESGFIAGNPVLDENDEAGFLLWGAGGLGGKSLDLLVEATQQNMVGPKQKRRGDCEDYVLTKMQAIIESGILPAESLQIMLCYVVNAGYHAVLGIQTTNKGFLISDQRDYGWLWEIEQLSETHIWESMSVSSD